MDRTDKSRRHQRRRAFIKIGAAMLAFASLGISPAASEDWKPRRPVNLIVPFNAGGGVDTYARAVSAGLQEKLGVPVVVVNKPGSGGITGATEASNARPDGQTLLFTSFGSFLLGSMFKETQVNPIDSFDAIAQAGRLVFAVAVPKDSPFQNAQDLIAAAKADPEGLRWAHAGRGGTTHVAGKTLLDLNGATATDVPFKGGAKIRAAVIGSQVDFGVLGIQQSFGFDNEMRVVGVFSNERYPLAPDVPTFGEQGLESFNIDAPIGLTAPKGTPRDVIDTLERLVSEVVDTEDFAATMAPKGLAPAYKNGSDAIAGLISMRNGASGAIDQLKAGN